VWPLHVIRKSLVARASGVLFTGTGASPSTSTRWLVLSLVKATTRCGKVVVAQAWQVLAGGFESADRFERSLAVTVTLRQSADAYEALAERLDTGRVASPAGATIAEEILLQLTGRGDEGGPALVARDPRWVAPCLRLRETSAEVGCSRCSPCCVVVKLVMLAPRSTPSIRLGRRRQPMGAGASPDLHPAIDHDVDARHVGALVKAVRVGRPWSPRWESNPWPMPYQGPLERGF
jgi:hypothetical protein